uniref:Uncharacterized protein n=1 Tax=Arundo donax TaxID=35708 RepID=A0A0A9GKA7_ARUDO
MKLSGRTLTQVDNTGRWSTSTHLHFPHQRTLAIQLFLGFHIALTNTILAQQALSQFHTK